MLTHHFDARPLAGLVRAYRHTDAAQAFAQRVPFAGVAGVRDLGNGSCELCGAHGATSRAGWRDLLSTLATAGYTRVMTERAGAEQWWCARTGRPLPMNQGLGR